MVSYMVEPSILVDHVKPSIRALSVVCVVHRTVVVAKMVPYIPDQTITLQKLVAVMIAPSVCIEAVSSCDAVLGISEERSKAPLIHDLHALGTTVDVQVDTNGVIIAGIAAY